MVKQLSFVLDLVLKEAADVRHHNGFLVLLNELNLVLVLLHAFNFFGLTVFLQEGLLAFLGQLRKHLRFFANDVHHL